MSVDDLVELRHHLHSIAEVSGKENNTAAFIEKTLRQYNPDKLITDVGGNGIIARFGEPDNGPAVLIRCELDALPIPEENDLEYLSENENVGHKCGHDGHMAILCGVAQNLADREFKNGCVYLLFQPAEETGKGARAVLDDAKFKEINPDFVFALHNVPGFEKGGIIIRSGPFAAASVGFVARFEGESSHAAHPEQGKSPAMAVSHLIQSLSAMPQFHAPIEKAAKATIVQAHIGEQAFGTSPANGEVMATLRTYEDDLLEQMQACAKDVAEGIAKTYDLGLDTEWVEPFPATINDKEATEIVRSIASRHDIKIIENHIKLYKNRPGDLAGSSTLGTPGLPTSIGPLKAARTPSAKLFGE